MYKNSLNPSNLDKFTLGTQLTGRASSVTKGSSGQSTEGNVIFQVYVGGSND